MAICGQCSSTIQSLRPQDWPRAKDHTRKVVSLPAFQPGTCIECWICRKFYRWLEAEKPKVLDTWSHEALSVVFHSYASFHIDQPNSKMLAPFFVEILPIDNFGQELGCQIELNFVCVEDADPKRIIAQEAHKNGQLDFGLIGAWLNQCSENHERCIKLQDETWYPTRLLYLGSQDSEVKLILSADNPPNSPYVTLSHRWGTQKYARLENSNIEQLKQGIDVPSLPQVFQDAIKIGRRIGIGYLWIDALCIKQDKDDLSDWARESLTMGKVYTKATLNLSATLSKDGSESLFHQSPRSHLLPSIIDLDVNGSCQGYYVLDGNLWQDEIDDAALNHRGWVYQERILSRRVLHFGEHQMAWECQELEALELLPLGLPGMNAMSFKIKSILHSADTTALQNEMRPQVLDILDDWHNLVEAYSKTQFTVVSDKLVAFAGVAEALLKGRNDRYLAGMFESTLVYDLAWTRYTWDKEAFPIAKTSSRAPSWSWASVDGEIAFPSLFGGVKMIFATSNGFEDEAESSDRVIGSFGAAKVNGICFPVVLEWSDENDDPIAINIGGFRFTMDESLGQNEVNLEISREECQELWQERKLLILPLFASAFFFYAILVAPAQESECWRRVGAVRIHLKAKNQQQTQYSSSSSQSSALQSSIGAEASHKDGTSLNIEVINFMVSITKQTSLARTITLV